MQLGYCVPTTSDGMYQESGGTASGNPAFQPANGMTSEMWQKVQIPTNAKSMEFRVAFFSTEFPKFVGSQYNDSFFIKFDESPDTRSSWQLERLGRRNSTTN